MASNPTRIMVVDGHPIVRLGIQRVVRQQSTLKWHSEAESLVDAVNTLDKNGSDLPDVIITELALPQGCGFELVQSIKHHARILVFTSMNVNLYGEKALRVGARGYIDKGEGTRELLRAIDKVASGGFVFPAGILERAVIYSATQGKLGKQRLETLARREKEVFLLIGEGLSTIEIGKRLGVKPKTVEGYRDKLKEKLGISSTHLLRQYAYDYNQEHGAVPVTQ